MSAKRVFEGLNVVVVGLILLANTTGMLPWSVWWTIATLWPLLIVSVGLDLVGRALDSSLLRVVGSLVVTAGLVYAAALSGAGITAPAWQATAGSSRNVDYRVPPESGITSARLKVAWGPGKVAAWPGAEGTLLTAKGEAPFGSPRLTEARPGGGVIDIGIDGGPSGAMVAGVSDRSYLDVTMDKALVWERFELDSGLTQADLTLPPQVKDFHANVGLSDLTVRFGAGGGAAEIDGGLSNVRLQVPAGVAVELDAADGLGSVGAPADWKRVSGDGLFTGVWHSDGYETSAAKLQIRVRAGLSNVRVERY
jgi:hypothetical protein